jgi:hypothetical protein
MGSERAFRYLSSNGSGPGGIFETLRQKGRGLAGLKNGRVAQAARGAVAAGAR